MCFDCQSPSYECCCRASTTIQTSCSVWPEVRILGSNDVNGDIDTSSIKRKYLKNSLFERRKTLFECINIRF